MRFFEHQESARAQTRRLLLAFALAVLLLVVAVHLALTVAWWLMAAGIHLMLGIELPFPLGFLAANVGVSLLLVLGGWWVETSELRAGGLRLAKRIGAREARPSVNFDEQRFCNVLDELCIAGGVRRPQPIVITRTDAINAFAAGWDESDAIVAVTQGALDNLTREELQGMVAHELSHLREGDTRLKMRLAGMVFGLELVYNFGDSVRERGGLAIWFGSAIMVAGWAGWLTGQILKAAVSRQREFLADARAVQWTRSKDGLGGVLRKVMTQKEEGYDYQMHRSGIEHPAVQHMLLVEASTTSGLGHRLDSHPSLEDRVKRIYGRTMGPLDLTPEKVPQSGHYDNAIARSDGTGPQAPDTFTLI